MRTVQDDLYWVSVSYNLPVITWKKHHQTFFPSKTVVVISSTYEISAGVHYYLSLHTNQCQTNSQRNVLMFETTTNYSYPMYNSSQVVLAMVPTHQNGSGLGLGPEPNCCNGFYHTKTRTVAIGPVLPPITQHLNNTTLAPIKYLSSDHIVTWSVHRLCSFTSSFASCIQICDPTNIRRVAIEIPQIPLRIGPFFTATQRILVGSQIWMLEVKEIIILHNLHTNHVTVQSELTNLIGAKAVATINLEPWAGSNLTKYLRFYVWAG